MVMFYLSTLFHVGEGGTTCFFYNKYLMEYDHAVMDCMKKRIVEQNQLDVKDPILHQHDTRDSILNNHIEKRAHTQRHTKTLGRLEPEVKVTILITRQETYTRST